MITGDNPLTACYVAKECLLCEKSEEIWMMNKCKNLNQNEYNWIWDPFSSQSLNSIKMCDFSDLSNQNQVYCICGDVNFDYI